MGFPVLPLLLLGVGVLALRRRTRTAKKAPKDELPPPVLIPVVYIPPQDREPPKRPSPSAKAATRRPTLPTSTAKLRKPTVAWLLFAAFG